jgi:hypothetical protein
MEIPYLDYAKHVKALVGMGKSFEHDFNKISGWSGLKNRVNIKILRIMFKTFAGWSGLKKCLEQDFGKIAGWSGLKRVLKNRVNPKIL